MRPDVTAIVAAAGRGTRFGAARNKVLEPLLGRPILRWTLEALAASGCIGHIVIAASGDDVDEVTSITIGLSLPCTVVTGGETRQDSVERALEEVIAPIIAVHDAARPLITPDIVAACIRSVEEHGTGIAAIPVADTLKHAPEGIAHETVDREGLWATQTPQCCRTNDLRRAYEVARQSAAQTTDEAALLQNAGTPVHLVNASPMNLKITTPDDLALAEAIIGARDGGGRLPRIGYGYDVHRFADGRRMVLGGVDFQLDYGLLGHSDADAVLHAVMDALLGAAGLQDIGCLYPNTDDRWSGASSMDLLADVHRHVEAAGYRVGNVDVTVIAERPKIAPHSARMKANIANVLKIAENAVAVKATTAEGLGDLGSGAGLAAHAVALLIRN